jgi:pimeloyl-ACP methyl ester carboxylesterase
LLAAWIDSDSSMRQRTDSPLYRGLPEMQSVPAFDAGMLLISPAVNLVEYADSLDEPRTTLGSPVRAAFQNRAAARMRERGKARTGNFWAYVRQELERSHWRSEYASYPELLAGATEMLDFTGPGWNRLRTVRAPVLVVQSADDPVVGTPQAAVDLMAMTDNPNCGLILLRDGGHAAFSAAETAYYYSLVCAFFDPASAPAAAPPVIHNAGTASVPAL